MSIESADNSEETSVAKYAWIAYAAPMAVFMIFTSALEPFFKSQYVWIYSAKILAITILLITYRKVWAEELRPSAKGFVWGLVVGLAVFAEWILLDKWIPYHHLGTRTALNPFVSIANPMHRALFIAVRFYGLALIVPIMEELFWRSFLLSYITNPEFRKLRLGEFSWGAFWAVAVMFGFSHPEWLAAIICAAAYGLLLRKTKSLFACVVAHSVTNFVLGVFVLVTKDWKYW